MYHVSSSEVNMLRRLLIILQRPLVIVLILASCYQDFDLRFLIPDEESFLGLLHRTYEATKIMSPVSPVLNNYKQAFLRAFEDIMVSRACQAME